MKGLKALIATTGLSAVLLLGAACANGAAAPEPAASTGSPRSNQIAVAPALPVGAPPDGLTLGPNRSATDRTAAPTTTTMRWTGSSF